MMLYFSAGFLIKFALIVISASFFYRRLQKAAESLVCGWLIVYVGQITLLLILSGFNAMNRIGILLGSGLAIVLICAASYRKRPCLNKFFHGVQDRIRQWDMVSYIAASIFLLLAVYILLHNALFFDGTWDAHTYQVPRIELFVQKETLFVNMKSIMINIFANEWNGELNAVYYAILCGTNQGMFLANAENFFYSLLVVYWFCRKIGINKNLAFLSMIGYCSMPIVVLLSMTVKGDFVTIPFFLAAVVFLKDYVETHSSHSLFFLITSGALAAGSKISMVPFLGLCFIVVVIFLAIENRGNIARIFRYITGIWKILLLGFFCAMISCARYFLNKIFYGELFKRVDTANEKLTISWLNLKTSIAEMGKTLLNSDNMFTQEGTVWALGADMGMLGVIFLIFFLPTIILHRYFKKREKLERKMFYIWFPVIGSMMFFMASTTWFPWSFRYYLPWILVFFFLWILMLQEIFSNKPAFVKKIAVFTVTLLEMICLFSTIVLTTRYGEVTHSSWKDAYKKPLIEREYAFHSSAIPAIYDFFDEIKSGKKVLICNSGDTAISYLFGADNSNDVTFCVPEEVIAYISGEEQYDCISISDVFLTEELDAYFANDDWICHEILQAHVFIRRL